MSPLSHRRARPLTGSCPAPAKRAARLAHVAAVLSLAATGLSVPAVAGAAADRVEIPIASVSPQTDVVSSLVKIRVPMPASAPEYPEACDWLQYERFRGVGGPTDPMQADAVAVLMPGLIEGATAFDPVARNTIREAARRGRHIEVWAIDRRANCLEDLTGQQAAETSADPASTLLDYYYGGKPIDGRRFSGFHKSERILAELGVAQTVRDYDAVLTHELPSQPWREQHVICGGHSLGGPLTEIFASWDFDGDPKTTDDAGYRQCAGFVGFDTTLHGDLSGGTSTPPDALTKAILGSVHDVTVAGLRSGVIPRFVNLSGISPETMGLLESLGLFAHRHPGDDWSALVKRIPRTADNEAFLHLSGSSDLNRYLFSKDSMRDLRYSFAAALGQIMDDNGAVFGLVRASFGFFDGAPVQRNRLPAALSKVPLLGEFVAPGQLAIPQRTRANPLIGWKNYDELGGGLGAGFTSPAGEVTDFDDFSRILFEGPTNLTEDWFPIRLLLESLEIEGGDRSREFSGIQHPDGIVQKPRFAILAGDGLRTGRTPTDPNVVLPGYQHLDVITAAEHQNDGRPEGSSQALANLIDQAVPR